MSSLIVLDATKHLGKINKHIVPAANGRRHISIERWY